MESDVPPANRSLVVVPEPEQLVIAVSPVNEERLEATRKALSLLAP